MSSRILVVGAGGMGSVAAKTAYDLPETAALTIADIDLGQAGALAATIGERAGAVAVDIRDPAQIDAAIEGHDIVLNATGPFYQLGPVVLQAAIRAGAGYADICDDWEPTLDMLALSSDAEKSGCIALIGMGASPGITNMLAVMAAHQLDQVDEIITGWSIDGAGNNDEDGTLAETAPPSAALVHWLQQLTGTIRVHADGALADRLPLQRRQLRYPDFGDLAIWSVGHPEAVTLPRAFPGLRACSNVMVGRDAYFETLSKIAGRVDAGHLSIRQAAMAVRNSLSVSADPDRASPPRPELFAWAAGHSNGRRQLVGAQLIAAPAGGMGGVTGVPLALAIPFLTRLRGNRAGVFCPEDIVDPNELFALLGPHCAGHSAGRSVVYLSTEIVDD